MLSLVKNTQNLPLKKMVDQNGCSGFFIMAEGSQIDWAGHENDFDYQYKEMDEFHDVVGHALEFVQSRDDTLLIVLSDHETGGCSRVGNEIVKGMYFDQSCEWKPIKCS